VGGRESTKEAAGDALVEALERVRTSTWVDRTPRPGWSMVEQVTWIVE
jgi:hypothetical protein